MTKKRGRRTAARRTAPKETFTRWDAADHLRSDEDILAYLEACLEEAGDDPTFIAAALGDIACARGMTHARQGHGASSDNRIAGRAEAGGKVIPIKRKA